MHLLMITLSAWYYVITIVNDVIYYVITVIITEYCINVSFRIGQLEESYELNIHIVNNLRVTYLISSVPLLVW